MSSNESSLKIIPGRSGKHRTAAAENFDVAEMTH